MVQLIPVISVETKEEEFLRRHSLYSGQFLPGWTVPFDISSEKNGEISHRTDPINLPYSLLCTSSNSQGNKQPSVPNNNQVEPFVEMPAGSLIFRSISRPPLLSLRPEVTSSNA